MGQKPVLLIGIFKQKNEENCLIFFFSTLSICIFTHSMSASWGETGDPYEGARRPFRTRVYIIWTVDLAGSKDVKIIYNSRV